MKKNSLMLTAKLCLVLCLLVIASSVVLGQSEEGQPGVLRNPLNVMKGEDPWLTYYEGNYYLSTTSWGSELTMRKSPTLAGLKTATPILIYSETEASRCCNIWAPEFHLLDGPDGLRWYFYYTAGVSGNLDNQHTHVLESAGTDPMGPYTYKARIFDPQNDVWAIDGSVLQLDDALYFLFSSWEGDYQSLFIAPMSDPWTLSGSRVRISRSEYEWEKSGLNVNEGPVALQHDGKTFIIYSASFCATPDYKLGMLTYSGGDPLDAASWVKNPEPVFQRSDENGVFGPGHNGFFKSPDGAEDWIAYHANVDETSGCTPARTTRVQKFTWNEDGTPNFGIPVSTDEVIDAPSGDEGIDPLPDFKAMPLTRYRQFNSDNAYIRHSGPVARVDFDVTPLLDSQFIVVPGLSDPSGISIQALNLPGYYLRHEGNALVFSAWDGTDAIYADATWIKRPGLADETAISFESANQPGSYIGRKFGVMALVTLEELKTDAQRADATFIEEVTQNGG